MDYDREPILPFPNYGPAKLLLTAAVLLCLKYLTVQSANYTTRHPIGTGIMEYSGWQTDCLPNQLLGLPTLIERFIRGMDGMLLAAYSGSSTTGENVCR